MFNCSIRQLNTSTQQLENVGNDSFNPTFQMSGIDISTVGVRRKALKQYTFFDRGKTLKHDTLFGNLEELVGNINGHNEFSTTTFNNSMCFLNDNVIISLYKIYHKSHNIMNTYLKTFKYM